MYCLYVLQAIHTLIAALLAEEEPQILSRQPTQSLSILADRALEDQLLLFLHIGNSCGERQFPVNMSDRSRLRAVQQC